MNNVILYGNQALIQSSIQCCKDICGGKAVEYTVIGAQAYTGVALEALAAPPFFAPTLISGPCAFGVSVIAGCAGIISCIGACCNFVHLPDYEIEKQIEAESKETENTLLELHQKCKLYEEEHKTKDELITANNNTIKILEKDLKTNTNQLHIEETNRSQIEKQLSEQEYLLNLLEKSLESNPKNACYGQYSKEVEIEAKQIQFKALICKVNQKNSSDIREDKRNT